MALSSFAQRRQVNIAVYLKRPFPCGYFWLFLYMRAKCNILVVMTKGRTSTVTEEIVFFLSNFPISF